MKIFNNDNLSIFIMVGQNYAVFDVEAKKLWEKLMIQPYGQFQKYMNLLEGDIEQKQ